LQGPAYDRKQFERYHSKPEFVEKEKDKITATVPTKLYTSPHDPYPLEHPMHGGKMLQAPGYKPYQTIKYGTDRNE
jgi:hypothetical protein